MPGVTEKELAQSIDEVAQVTATAITCEIQQSEQRLKDYMHDSFATKEDLERFATKEDLERFATKEQFDRVLQIVESIDRKLPPA